MKIKKYISFIFFMLMMLITTSVFADFSDIPGDSSYKGAVDRLGSLGIMNGNGDGTFGPENSITREQFAKMIVTAAGLEDTADSSSGSSIFPDVDPNGWSSGYINVAIEKGYITGKADSKFHPNESITFAEACTIMVKALGYTNEDVTGTWPRNYVEKAKNLSLTPNLTFSNNDPLPRWAAAVMIDKLMSTSMKSSDASTTKTFADISGAYIEGIILGNSDAMEKISPNQVLTDKGIYYVKNEDMKLELGEKYKFSIKDGDVIDKAYNMMNAVKKVTVSSAVDTTVTYWENGKIESMVLPEKATYYYNGVETAYADLKGVLQANSSIVFTYNDAKTGFAYATIFDPIFSKPETVGSEPIAGNKIGSIDLNSRMTVLRNTIKIETTPPVNKVGEQIEISKIKEYDVVYKVTDVWGANEYILVIDNKIDGEIEGFLPNKVSPQTIRLSGVDYTFSKDMVVNKINNTPGSFKVEDKVTLLLGHDGNVVDIVNSSSSSTANYAFVLNYTNSYSKDIEDYRTDLYTVKLLFTDGTIDTYNTNETAAGKFGKLVRYTRIDDDTVKLEDVDYFADKKYTFDKIEGKIDSYYAASNIKIFNVIPSTYVNQDAEVSLLDWSKMPHGVVESGKVLYTNTAGPFADINIMVTSDILDSKIRLGVVSKTGGSSSSSSYSNTLKVGDKDYSVSTGGYIETGSVMYADIQYGSLKAHGLRTAAAVAEIVEAVDKGRIRVDGKTFKFNDYAKIYFIDSSGELIAKGTSDIETNKKYRKVSVYTDNFSKAEIVVITE